MHESYACELKTSISEADLREGPGGPRQAAPYFWTKLRPEGVKNMFLKTAPPLPLSQGLDDPLPSPLI